MLSGLEGLNKDNSNVCTVEATVPTGLEGPAKEECLEKIATNNNILSSRGRLIFDVPIGDVGKVLHLRSVDNLSVLIGDFGTFKFTGDKEADLAKIERVVDDLDWIKGLDVWKIKNASEDVGADAAEARDDGNDVDGQHVLSSAPSFRFRVTCNRAGQNHSFQSQEAAALLGSGVIGKFGWKADMSNFDVEVLLNICDEHLYVGLALTTKSLHRRNITHFGYTTLRSTIAYNMLRLAKIRDNDVVCDPMCGSGAIPIEASISWPNAYHIAGDNHDLAWSRTKDNLHALNAARSEDKTSSLQLDIFQWNVLKLPLRDGSVDVFITDLPFGKRCGSKEDNRKLYPSILQEMARVGTPASRVVLLTHDRRNMIRCLQKMSSVWKTVRTLHVNIGGLLSGVYLLSRASKS